MFDTFRHTVGRPWSLWGAIGGGFFGKVQTFKCYLTDVWQYRLRAKHLVLDQIDFKRFYLRLNRKSTLVSHKAKDSDTFYCDTFYQYALVATFLLFLFLPLSRKSLVADYLRNHFEGSQRELRLENLAMRNLA